MCSWKDKDGAYCNINICMDCFAKYKRCHHCFNLGPCIKCGEDVSLADAIKCETKDCEKWKTEHLMHEDCYFKQEEGTFDMIECSMCDKTFCATCVEENAFATGCDDHPYVCCEGHGVFSCDCCDSPCCTNEETPQDNCEHRVCNSCCEADCECPVCKEEAAEREEEEKKCEEEEKEAAQQQAKEDDEDDEDADNDDGDVFVVSPIAKKVRLSLSRVKYEAKDAGDKKRMRFA